MYKFRAFYNNHITHLENRLDEVVFNGDIQNLDELKEFHKIYPDIFIWILTDINPDTFLAHMPNSVEAAQDFVGGIMLGSIKQVNKKVVDILHHLNVKVSCIEPVYTFAGVQHMLDCEIDDFGITNPITFNMDAVTKICGFDRMNRVWVCPDISQYEAGESEKGFYILPQHLKFFAEEFKIEKFFIMNESISTSAVIDIYTNEEWNPIIWPLVTGYTNKEIEAGKLLPTFAIRRANCKHVCFHSGHCNTCCLTIKSPKIEEK